MIYHFNVPRFKKSVYYLKLYGDNLGLTFYNANSKSFFNIILVSIDLPNAFKPDSRHIKHISAPVYPYLN